MREWDSSTTTSFERPDAPLPPLVPQLEGVVNLLERRDGAVAITEAGRRWARNVGV